MLEMPTVPCIIRDMSDPDAVVNVHEYVTACYGTTEYTERMEGITLGTARGEENESMEYAYKDRQITMPGASEIYAVVPQIKTRMSMRTDRAGAEGYVREGYAFSPMFHLGYRCELKNGEEETTWLSLEKAN